MGVSGMLSAEARRTSSDRRPCCAGDQFSRLSDLGTMPFFQAWIFANNERSSGPQSIATQSRSRDGLGNGQFATAPSSSSLATM